MEYLYKTAGQEWLINLLKDGKLKTINKDWISLSLDEYSGYTSDYGNMTITFNKDMIMSEPNCYEVDYEDSNFFEMFPTITKHVTGYSNEEEYYSDKGYDGPDEANDDGELTWEQYCEGYSDEQEVVIDEIFYKDGLIINVEFNEKPEPQLLDLLKSKNIKYTINEVKENLNTLPEVIDYKGYTINLKKSDTFKNSYICSVYLNDEYKMGLRGPCNYNKGKEAAILFIDGQIKNKNTIKENNTMKYVKTLFKKSTTINESNDDKTNLESAKEFISKWPFNTNLTGFMRDKSIEGLVTKLVNKFDISEMNARKIILEYYPKLKESTENNNLLNIQDIVTDVDDCLVLHLNLDEHRITKFDVIRMEASNFNCEIIGIDEGKIFIGSKTAFNTKDIEDFKNYIKDMINETKINETTIGDDISTANMSREDLNKLIYLLDNNDISYDLDGPNETINFDITELSKEELAFAKSLFTSMD